VALTIPCDTRRVLTIDEYVDHVKSLDLKNEEGVAASAPMLKALANDRTLVVRMLNQQIEDAFRSAALPSAQTIFLGGGADFYVRAAIWPSSSAVSGGRLYQERFAYDIAHDHNFSFLTVNYLGPGYETEIYEYSYDKIEGYSGEPVDLRFLEKVRFGQATAMFYRASRDVHIQHPPEELTVTLNLMISLPEVRTRDQFFFDTTRKLITDYVSDTNSSKRVSLLRMAAHLGDAHTADLLQDIAKRHDNRRVRLTAFDVLSERQPERRGAIWESACFDRDRVVVGMARRRLKELAND
jgi:hypothetical protein